MAYSTLATVVERLPGHAGAQDDSELSNCIAAADAIIDNALRNFTSVPLSSPPQIIKDISADLAAGIFKQRRQPPDEENILIEAGRQRLQDYIRETYLESYSSSNLRFRKIDELDERS